MATDRTAEFNRQAQLLSRAATAADATGIAAALLLALTDQSTIHYIDLTGTTPETTAFPKVASPVDAQKNKIAIGQHLWADFRKTFAHAATESVSLDAETSAALSALVGGSFELLPVEQTSHTFGFFVARKSQSPAEPAAVLARSAILALLTSRLEALHRQPQTEAYESGERTERARVLTLIRHRSLESLGEPLVQSVAADLQSTRTAVVFLGTDKKSIRSLALEPPLENRTIRSMLTGSACSQAAASPLQIDSSVKLDSQGAGKYQLAIPFRLDANRPGLLLVAPDHAAKLATEKLRQTAESVAQLISNVESFEALEALSQTDPLTGLANQRYLIQRLHQEIERARRHDRSLALIMFDVDDLKTVNDTSGHQTGDALLKAVSQAVRKLVRSNDVVARYGGDEFCILMPEADLAQCERLLRRLVRDLGKGIERAQQPLLASIHPSASFGGAVFPDHADSPDRLIYCADMALLRSKSKGRLQWLLFDAVTQP